MPHDSDIAFALDEAGAPLEPPKSPHTPLRIICPASLAGKEVPERRWLVPDWIPLGHATGLYGDGGTGKSLLAQQLLTSVATGKPFLGVEAQEGPALGIFCEDDDAELWRRQAAINEAYDLNWPALEAIAWMPRIGEDNLFVRFENGVATLTPFFWRARQLALDLEARAIVLDTASDFFGGNENNRSEVRQFMQGACARLARDTGGAVIVCAHPSRAGLSTGTGDSGSTHWSNSFRSRLYFERLPTSEEDPEPDPDVRRFSRKKANYAAAGAEIEMRYQRGAFVTEGGSSPVGWIDRQGKENRAEETFLRLLSRTEAEGRRVSHKPRAGNYAPKAFAKRPDRDGLRRQDFEAAMERLFARGALKVATVKDEHRNSRDVLQVAEADSCE